MGAQQNAERIRGGYDAFNKANIKALTDLFAEDEYQYDLYAWDEFWS